MFKDGKILNKIYKGIFEKITSEVSICQNTAQKKLF